MATARAASSPAATGGGPRALAPRGAALLLIGAAVAGMLVIDGVEWAGVSGPLQRGSDFSASYVAALVWRDGNGDRLYDQPLEARRHAAINSPGYRTNLPFITPPLTAALAAPLTAVDPETAFRLAGIVEGLLLVAAAAIAVRAAPWPARAGRVPRATAGLAAVAAVATLPVLLMAQWDGICAFGIAAGYALWRRERNASAGFTLTLCVATVKPHLGLGIAALLAGRRDRPAIAGAVAALLVDATASIGLLGARASREWFGALWLSLGHTPPASSEGASGLITSWLGSGPITLVLTLTAMGVSLLGCAWLGAFARHRPEKLGVALGGATALSLLAAPHVLGHDLALLIPVAAWLVAEATRADVDRGRLLWPSRDCGRLLLAWLAFNVVAFVDLGNGAAAPPGRIVPLALAAIGVACVRNVRQTEMPA